MKYFDNGSHGSRKIATSACVSGARGADRAGDRRDRIHIGGRFRERAAPTGPAIIIDNDKNKCTQRFGRLHCNQNIKTYCLFAAANRVRGRINEA